MLHKQWEAREYTQVCLKKPAHLEFPKIGRRFLESRNSAQRRFLSALWLPVLNRYRARSHMRSAFELLVTAVPFVLLWIAACACLRWSYWLSLAVAVPAAGFLGGSS